jgi:hypothetical protein
MPSYVNKWMFKCSVTFGDQVVVMVLRQILRAVKFCTLVVITNLYQGLKMTKKCKENIIHNIPSKDVLRNIQKPHS